MLISEIMTTKFVNCTAGTTLQDTLPLFLNSNSNMLPVVNDTNKLIGIITKNKLFQLLVTQPSFDITIDQVYNTKPIFIYPTDTIDNTRQLLLKHNIGHAPVVNNDLEPIGIISTQQLLSSYSLAYSQLVSVTEFANDAIILVNEKAEVTMVNNSFSDLFNMKNNDVLNRSTTDLFPELDIENMINNGVSINNTPQIIADQQCLVSFVPIKENGETISGICRLTYRGLTHLHEALSKVRMLEKQVSAYKSEIREQKGTKYTLFDIAGESNELRQVKQEAMLASKSMSTVLITGESGTGKELFAHGIHVASSRPGSFVQVNCAAIPPDLLESEFFGYESGAFTGAKKGGMKGKFELAQNGTIFLDEIGDMPLPLQTKILRVLQEKEFQPIGSSKTIYLNTKIIAATNQKLEQLVEDGRFREDLYYRLNIMRLTIPPLRERIEDLPNIIQLIIQRLNDKGFYIKGITHLALIKLMRHSWPGNVRELENTLERAANLRNGDYIDVDVIPSFTRENKSKTPPPEETSSTYKEMMHSTEKDMIISALRETKGNKTKASKLLGISRPWLYKKIKRYGID
ncbi:sigma 54-interacting transcriptional regulator [Lentibacillus sp. N15]|uniref:sigma 54-interacting transcriptional regulator n=1 Tax=Lentibacillus songyuanensis TaxID=3136161 RepID=UPI0031B9C445